MNKYLEKIAAKIELEPGVNYDLAKHDIAVSRQRMADHIQSKDTTRRGIVAGAYAPLGGLVGYGMARNRIKDDNYKAQPTTESVIHSPTAEDTRAWRRSEPKLPPMGLGDWIDNVHPDPHAVKAHSEWLHSQPRTTMQNIVTPGANNLVGRLAGKYGIGRVMGVGKALGGVAGVTALGGFGYLTGGADDEAKADYKNSYLHHLEKKHDAKIHELEGWG